MGVRCGVENGNGLSETKRILSVESETTKWIGYLLDISKEVSLEVNAEKN
jgi:hypothetical protein